MLLTNVIMDSMETWVMLFVGNKCYAGNNYSVQTKFEGKILVLKLHEKSVIV